MVRPRSAVFRPRPAHLLTPQSPSHLAPSPELLSRLPVFPVPEQGLLRLYQCKQSLPVSWPMTHSLARVRFPPRDTPPLPQTEFPDALIRRFPVRQPSRRVSLRCAAAN